MTKEDKAAKRQRQFMEWAKSDVGQAFTNWWRVHWASGFATKGRETRWGIRPYYAWNDWRYRAEFYLECEDEYPAPLNFKAPDIEDIEKWRMEKDVKEAMTAELEQRFGKDFWKHMTPQQWITGAKKVALENMAVNFSEQMEAKLNEAYATELGQSEEETEALRRRRE